VQSNVPRINLKHHVFLRFALPIHFESVAREARLLNPLRNFELDTQVIEHRQDPLTDRRVIVLRGRLDYVRRYLESDEAAVADLANSTQQDCPFCPDSVEKRAPKFVPEISPEGRIHSGEAVCFPSLFAHEDYNAVVVPTRSHKITLNEMRPAMFVDAFKVCVEYFRRLHDLQPGVKNNAIVMNFYPPAGSTIAHPHVQALASDLPIQATNELLEASAAYYRNHNSSYWAELVQQEKRLGDRYLATRGRVNWLTPFAPKGLNEAQAIIPEVSNLPALVDGDLVDIAEGVVRVVRYYYDSGLRSFNMAVYSGPFGGDVDYFGLNLRIVSRYGYKPSFVSDIWALQYLLGEQEVFEAPEETCSKLRKYFQ
jgi:galactose-1-phosphate uridylyltransferase